MRPNYLRETYKTAVLALTVIVVLAGTSLAQSTVALTAAPINATLPDGQVVPMWGYSCGTVTGTNASCAALNQTPGAGWSPVLITVPAGDLTINLSNALPAPVPTSLTIVGTLGGGLGAGTTAPGPAHAVQGATWPIAGDSSGALFTPPKQGPRVQSFGTEVANGAAAVPLQWLGLKPGTYLIESGTHPSIQGPMGLYGVLVITDPLNPGKAYGTSFDADGVVLLSEIDAVQNRAVSTAVATTGFSETAARVLRDSVSSASVALDSAGNPIGGSGYSVGDVVSFSNGGASVVASGYVSATDASGAITAVTVDNPGKGYSSVPSAQVTSVNGSGAQLVAALSLSGVMCSNGAAACYPPAVNYDPRYYLVNGRPLDRTNPSNAEILVGSLGAPLTIANGVLLRFVNAGLRMHVPSVVGLDMSLLAEDANALPGTPKVQSEVFLAAGKVYDVLVKPSGAAQAYGIFDRQLSLSTDNQRDGGMQAYLSINGGAPPAAAGAIARADKYFLVPGKTLTVSDPIKGVIGNDVNVYGVAVQTAPTGSGSTLALNANGTFTYIPGAGVTQDSFTYQANGVTGPTATVTLAPAPIEGASGITLVNETFTARTAVKLDVARPGVLVHASDAAGYPLTVDTTTITPSSGLKLTVNEDGSFRAEVPGTGSYTFTYQAKNSQGTQSAKSATVTLVFPAPSNLQVSVVDAKTKAAITDYRWIIEEDRTFHVDPNVKNNLGVNFHTSYMPVVAQGCVGTVSCELGQTVLDPSSGNHVGAVCDGNGVCRTDAPQETAVDPSQVVLDPAKYYYISVLPGDGADPFNTGNASPGHTMGGAPIAPSQPSVTVGLEATPLEPTKVSVFVFEDDNPLNGENDAGGGIDVLATNEPGLGGFEITLFDDAGGPGDATGQITYDMFNMPVSNALAGTIDPATGLDACPISGAATKDQAQKGIVGVVVTCPHFESDGVTQSPLEGQAVIANLYPGRYGVVANPAADRIGKGEEWLQTNTLDGQKAHDSFIKVGGPAYFQEYGPAGFHVSVGFANPAIINARLPQVCAGKTCSNGVDGTVTTMRLSRTPDERLYSSGSRDSFGFTQCYVSIGDADGEDIAFTKCDGNGFFSFSGLPDGDYRMTLFDQWNDQIVDGLSVPVRLAGGTTVHMGDVPAQQWHTNVYTRTYFDANGDGVSQDTEPGLSLVPVNIRFRDGSFSNFNSTDLDGYAGFNEIFPLFNWYVLEADTTRYKQTGVHVVYDAGGPADGTTGGGSSKIADHLAHTLESGTATLPTNLRVPGAVYCGDADCSVDNLINYPNGGGHSGSTGRIDPAWVTTEAWQGFIGQNEFVEFGKKAFAAGENGGIKGHVVYASTRPFDDPALLLQLSWEPLVPGVTVNLYQEGTAADGTQSLKLVDTTKTSSWDDWAQGFRSDGVPNMNCPGQETSDVFYYTLYGSTQWLNPSTPLPNNSQFKCYDGMHNFNQVQPAPYDGMYQFPSVTGRDTATGKPTGTNCTICSNNPTGDGTQMLPAGKYVVEVVVPPGYELVKEEDKNILIGDNYIAPVTQQFGGLGSVFILPDQASVDSAYNPNNPQNPTNDLGVVPRHEGDTGSIETFWPCVGQARVVPDYISLFPGSAEVAPFAGATRNLCDRKEVTLEDQMSVLAKFYIYSSTHVAAHFTGIITDDFTAEFDPFAPAFGEKFSPPNMPVSIKDFAGNEISRVYSDEWGLFNGLNYSTWEVNPPNPTGYAPTMMVTCMNDPGPIPDPAHPGQTMVDPAFNPNYSQFCYELPFMPGQTQYMDTPVVPTAAFADGYNQPDCSYPDATPAVKQVNGDGIGPWVSQAGNTLTIIALGDQNVPNNAYSGPSAKNAPFNQKTVARHYGFGTAAGTVTIGGITAALTGTGWTDTSIQVTVPSGVPACTMQQINVPAGTSTAQCGQLVVTTASGKNSVDAVTVTIGGKAPTHVTAGGSIQTAIDNAAPGDLIIVDPGTYNEMLLMWKPVRLQGAGAPSVIINANAHPSGPMKLDPWRRQVACLFGLALNGQPISSTNLYDSNPTNPYVCRSDMQLSADRIPLEGVVGWDTTLNGNLAELLQEPTLMGAYEGAGITVTAKGVLYPTGVSPFPGGVEGAFPPGTLLLTNSASDCTFVSNFLCNPSRIDGLSITNSSQGGGGVFVHAWAHSLEISNNRIYNNSGTLSGGLTVGNGEFPDGYIFGDATLDPPNPPVPVPSGTPAGTQLGYGFNNHVNVHHNYITQNASYGDELYSATPEAAGGITFCSGSDYYKFNYNWVCGNMSTGDGGGLSHLGFSYNGDIEHNWILFNQSNNPTIPTHGGGISVVAAGPDGLAVIGGVATECGAVTDVDCAPSLSEGTGPGLVINANLILGNTAESGSGGGIRLQGVNGQEVARFPNSPQNWYGVSITNNIIANNVAGWDGAGVSMQDSLKVDFINNTVASNDSTASAGVLFNTLGAPIANTPPPSGGPVTSSTFLPAGLVTMENTPNMKGAWPTTGFTCPAGHPNCDSISYPVLENNVFWQNRSFHIQVGNLGSGALSQQNLVTLVPELNQTSTGQCVTTGINGTGSVAYWDIGVRGDTAPNNHASGFTLTPTYSILTDAADYPGANNLGADPALQKQYCNGSKVPPENGGMGYLVPPGVADATIPNPVFNLTPSATVDEGNNWINMSWGPLSLAGSAFTPGNPSYNVPLGNYSIQQTSPAVDVASATGAPLTDFFGLTRPQGAGFDIGAVEIVRPVAKLSLSSSSIGFGYQLNGTSATQSVTLTNSGTAAASLSYSSLTGTGFTRSTSTGACGTTLAAGQSCAISISFAPPALQLTQTRAFSGTLTLTAPGGQPSSLTVSLSGTSFLLFNPLALIFPNTPVGSTSAAMSTTLNNQGNAPISITSVALSGGQFTAPTSNCGGTPPAISLAAHASCTVSTTFKPTSSGIKAALINFTVAGGTANAYLVGVGGLATQAAATLAGPTPALTTSTANTAIKTGNVTVTNTGTAQLTMTAAPTASGTGFSIVTPTGTGAAQCTSTTALAPGAACRIGVRYDPAGSTATRSGSVTITDTGAASASQTRTFNAN